MATRPKTGEKRKVRQPMSIDRLPQSVKDKIMELRGPEGRTWTEIEELSKTFVPWSTLPLDVQKLFPRKYLPKSNILRWYDVRVEQAVKENLEERALAQELAGAFKQMGFDGLEESVKNAAAKEIFLISRSLKDGDKAKFRGELLALGDLLVKARKVDIQAKKVEAEEARLAQQQEKIAAAIGEPREVYLRAAQDVLKKLRTRKNVREVIDPIREELISEFAHGAEAFAKSIEAGKA